MYKLVNQDFFNSQNIIKLHGNLDLLLTPSLVRILLPVGFL